MVNLDGVKSHAALLADCQPSMSDTNDTLWVAEDMKNGKHSLALSSVA